MSKDIKNNFVEDDIFYILGSFDDDMNQEIVPKLVKKISDLEKTKEASITFYINSYGGDGDILWHLVSLFELAKSKDIKIKTIVPSAAFSAGSMLAVAGTKGERYINKTAEHLIHYGQFDGRRKTTPLQLEREGKKWKRWTQNVVKHYEMYCKVPNLKEHIKDDGFFIPAKNCVKWKLADKHMDKL